jgi:hypothetical protein
MRVLGNPTDYKSWTQKFESGSFFLGGPGYGIGLPSTKFYVVVLKMITQPDPPLDAVIIPVNFDRNGFLLLLCQFGIPFAFFFGISFYFSAYVIEWRFDRIESWLVGLKAEVEENSTDGVQPNLLAAIFQSYNKTKSNISFRINLWVASTAVKLLLCFPIIILWAWGFSCAYSIQPSALGFSISFFGSAAIITGFSIMQWRALQFRMINFILFAFTYSFLMLIAFLVCSVFTNINGVSLTPMSIVFNLLNVVPLIIICFMNDSTMQERY